ncbi:MAG: hypothetical protein ACETV1_05665 [Candidatus Bathyarchaeia archaeon]
MEIRHGKNSLGIVFVLEKAISHDSKKHEWSPKADDMGLVSKSHSLLSKKPNLSTVGLYLSCDNHLRTRF